MSATRTPGKVWLVGAGPGDPGLLTRKGAAVLARAQALVYDRLVHPELPGLAPKGCRRVFVGKTPGGVQTPQEEIHRILAGLAQEGLEVVRLKGGDPFVFGRGGEEALYLRERGIPFEVVPGVTAGIAAPAYAGIPVTHRAVAVGVSLFTGHEDPMKDESQLDLSGLARPGTTGVFYMGRRALPGIVARLTELGRDPATPAAMIEWGTYPRQRVVEATLGTLLARAEAEAVEPPVITVIGEVAALRRELAWFKPGPLAGRTIAVTRAREQSSELVATLSGLGARVVEAPTIAIAPPEDPAALEAVLGRLSSYAWVLFTSVNGVEKVFEALARLGRDARAFAPVRIGAIGPGTAAALAGRGLVPDLVPSRFQAEGVLEALEGRFAPGDRFLLPRAAVARDVLPETLVARGASVDVVPAYRTACVEPEPEVVELFAEGGVDLVTFTSSSTVENFHRTLGAKARRGFKVACIGPITAETATRLGYPPDLVAEESTIPALVEALVARFGTRGP